MPELLSFCALALDLKREQIPCQKYLETTSASKIIFHYFKYLLFSKFPTPIFENVDILKLKMDSKSFYIKLSNKTGTCNLEVK